MSPTDARYDRATFRIADTFTDSLARLTGDEQKSVKTTAFDLQLNPAAPGMQFHKLDKARDRRFWSVRVSSDIRLIVHKTDDSLLLCYVDHHDKAYTWAERRKLETHPATGAAQLVEIRETVREIAIPNYVYAPAPVARKPLLLFDGVSRDALLSYGVPEEWTDDVLAATEDTLFGILDHIPQEAAESLMTLATGGTPVVAMAAPTASNPFAHPDAQRRFRVMNNVEELERALEFPWEKWSVPAFAGMTFYWGDARTSRASVQRAGSRRRIGRHRQDSGSTAPRRPPRAVASRFTRAGHDILGDTRAHAQIVVTPAKAGVRLVGDDNKLAQRITVETVDAVAITPYEKSFGTPRMATPGMLESLLASLSREGAEHSFTDRFLHHWLGYLGMEDLCKRSRVPSNEDAGYQVCRPWDAANAMSWSASASLYESYFAFSALNSSGLKTPSE